MLLHSIELSLDINHYFSKDFMTIIDSYSYLIHVFNFLIKRSKPKTCCQVGCKIVAVIVHFTTLATFFWTNIMAWDIYKTFGQRTVLSHIRPTGSRSTD